MNSYYICKKTGLGEYYKNCLGVSIRFIYKVFLCDTSCNPSNCKKCHQLEVNSPIQEGTVDVVLGDGLLHEFIEATLTKENIRRGSTVTFVLSSKDAFEELGVPNRVPPNANICCFLEEPAL